MDFDDEEFFLGFKPDQTSGHHEDHVQQQKTRPQAKKDKPSNAHTRGARRKTDKDRRKNKRNSVMQARRGIADLESEFMHIEHNIVDLNQLDEPEVYITQHERSMVLDVVHVVGDSTYTFHNVTVLVQDDEDIDGSCKVTILWGFIKDEKQPCVELSARIKATNVYDMVLENFLLRHGQEKNEDCFAEFTGERTRVAAARISDVAMYFTFLVAARLQVETITLVDAHFDKNGRKKARGDCSFYKRFGFDQLPVFLPDGSNVQDQPHCIYTNKDKPGGHRNMLRHNVEEADMLAEIIEDNTTDPDLLAAMVLPMGTVSPHNTLQAIK